ncbi:MAG: DoxX family protein [Chthoniobacterales bacterium]
MKLQFRDRIDFGLLVLRLGIGLMFVIVHGLPKLVGGVSIWKGLGGAFNRLLGFPFVPEFWGFLASVSEFGGGICLIAGVFFRPACVLMLFTMVIAVASIIRGGYGFNSASQPVELGIVLLGLLLTGPGKLTLPNLFTTWKATR